MSNKSLETVKDYITFFTTQKSYSIKEEKWYTMMKQNVRLRLAELERHLLTMFTDLVPEFQYFDVDEDELILHAPTTKGGQTEFLMGYDVIDRSDPITYDSIKVELLKNEKMFSYGGLLNRYELTLIDIGEQVLNCV